MPIYEYECAECGIHFDKLQRFGDPLPDACPNGHHKVHRLLSQPAIIFKGSGFYVTDHGRNGHTSTGTAKSKKTEHKSETKASTADTADD